MQWTAQEGRGRSYGVNNIGIYGHGVGLPLFGLGGSINSKSVKGATHEIWYLGGYNKSEAITDKLSGGTNPRKLRSNFRGTVF